MAGSPGVLRALRRRKGGCRAAPSAALMLFHGAGATAALALTRRPLGCIQLFNEVYLHLKKFICTAVVPGAHVVNEVTFAAVSRRNLQEICSSQEILIG